MQFPRVSAVFRSIARFSETRSRKRLHAPKASALPIAPHLVCLIFLSQFLCSVYEVCVAYEVCIAHEVCVAHAIRALPVATKAPASFAILSCHRQVAATRNGSLLPPPAALSVSPQLRHTSFFRSFSISIAYRSLFVKIKNRNHTEFHSPEKHEKIFLSFVISAI